MVLVTKGYFRLTEIEDEIITIFEKKNENFQFQQIILYFIKYKYFLIEILEI